ncbi:ABC-three component system middle component 6 [Planctomycetes bacterium TBK1r]|uniref:ABC-three component system middle component 6 n=1 Tax=Stieleria magnilauensis TaxID=2527963 RepID=UPI00119D98BB
MILPTKHLSPERSLLGIGALILGLLAQPHSVSSLWAKFQNECNEAGVRVSFDWFILALTMLFSIGAIQLSSGLIVRQERQQ